MSALPCGRNKNSGLNITKLTITITVATTGEWLLLQKLLLEQREVTAVLTEITPKPLGITTLNVTSTVEIE